jgi:hypothetical protein
MNLAATVPRAPRVECRTLGVRLGYYNREMIENLQDYARKGLEAELARLDAERERVKGLLKSLDGSRSQAVIRTPAPGKRPRQMSEAGRQAIREAVKRRWERVRAEAATGGLTGSNDTKPESTSAAARAARKRTQSAARTGNRKK